MIFRIGDKVTIVGPSTNFVQQFKDETGTITNIVEGDAYPYEVQMENHHSPLGFAENELAPTDFLEVVNDSIDALWAADTEPVEDEVNHPSHYTWLPNGIEVIDITELLNFNLGNVVKYTLRAGHKHDEPLTDLRKAAWYINREIERLEATQ
ncbi:DUF3310 domain-containing protein [Streptomyces sp. NPDC014622]|uniref:DUF3310 domain-containing protein n=1 Tax=Streptomyces sp. NPDC014622 TaxID=3364874 RepID=UPI003702799D